MVLNIEIYFLCVRSDIYLYIWNIIHVYINVVLVTAAGNEIHLCYFGEKLAHDCNFFFINPICFGVFQKVNDPRGRGALKALPPTISKTILLVVKVIFLLFCLKRTSYTPKIAAF